MHDVVSGIVQHEGFRDPACAETPETASTDFTVITDDGEVVIVACHDIHLPPATLPTINCGDRLTATGTRFSCGGVGTDEDPTEFHAHTVTVLATDDDDDEVASLAADMVLFADRGDQPHVLLIERRWDPDQGKLALPGGFVRRGEQTECAARRELAEETSLEDQVELTLVGVYAEPGRDPRGRVVSFAYTAMLERMPWPTAADDAARADWLPVADVLAHPDQLAFDHARILREAISVHPRLGDAMGRTQ